MSKIKLLVIDENEDFRTPLEQYALTVPTIQLLGVKTNVSEVIDQYRGEVPDLILYASALIKTQGVEKLQLLRDKWPNALYYRLTVFDDSVYDEFDYIKGFHGSVPRAQIDDHLNTIIQTFKCNSK